MKRRLPCRPLVRGEGRFIKQSGPIGRFGHVVLEVQCLETAQALVVTWDVSEDEIPAIFRNSVERGVIRLFGPEAKYEAFSSDGVSVRVVGGTCHPTDSNEVSFELASAAAFVNAIVS